MPCNSKFHEDFELVISLNLNFELEFKTLIKAMHCVLCMLCFFVDTVDTKIKVRNALNAMFVITINTGVCGFYTTLYTE